MKTRSYSGGWIVNPHTLYNTPPSKHKEWRVALAVLREGLEISDSGEPRYNPSNGKTWLGKLERELKGEVSRATIDKSLRQLVSEGILIQGQPVFEEVFGNGALVSPYYVSPDFEEKLLLYLKATCYAYTPIILASKVKV